MKPGLPPGMSGDFDNFSAGGGRDTAAEAAKKSRQEAAEKFHKVIQRKGTLRSAVILQRPLRTRKVFKLPKKATYGPVPAK